MLGIEFRGPLRILPSQFDNYGCDYSQSTLISLSTKSSPVIIFSANRRRQLDQCLLLCSSDREYSLFTIDALHLNENIADGSIESVLPDRYVANRYYLVDGHANVYRIELLWLDHLTDGQVTDRTTRIEHLISESMIDQKSSTCHVQHIGFIEDAAHNDDVLLTLVLRTENRDEKVSERRTNSQQHVLL